MLAYEEASQHAGRGAAAVLSFVSSGMGDDLEDMLADEGEAMSLFNSMAGTGRSP